MANQVSQYFRHIIHLDNLQKFRIKEIVIFFIGIETSNYLGQANKEPGQFECKLNVITDRILEITDSFKVDISKEQIVYVFTNLVANLKQIRQQLANKQSIFWSLYDFISLFQSGMTLLKNSANGDAFSSAYEKHINHFLQSKLISNSFTEQSKQIFKANVQIQQFRKQSYEQNFQIIKNQVNLGKICQICDQSIQQNQTDSLNSFKGLKISKCGHQFHCKCVLAMIQQNIRHKSSILFKQSSRIPYQNEQKQKNIHDTSEQFTLIKCPNFDQCSVRLTFSQVHKILLNAKDFASKDYKQQFNLKKVNLQRLYQLSFNDYLYQKKVRLFSETFKYIDKIKDQYDINKRQESIFFYCNTKGCNAIYQLEKYYLHSNTPLQMFCCFVCGKSFCLKCFSPLHSGMSCKQYAISNKYLPEDDELQKFIRTLRKPYMRCPNCQFYVDNWRGCSTIKCRCGAKFCYKCGGTQCPYAKCLKQTQNHDKDKD